MQWRRRRGDIVNSDANSDSDAHTNSHTHSDSDAYAHPRHELQHGRVPELGVSRGLQRDRRL